MARRKCMVSFIYDEGICESGPEDYLALAMLSPDEEKRVRTYLKPLEDNGTIHAVYVGELGDVYHPVEQVLRDLEDALGAYMPEPDEETDEEEG